MWLYSETGLAGLRLHPQTTNKKGVRASREIIDRLKRSVGRSVRSGPVVGCVGMCAPNVSVMSALATPPEQTNKTVWTRKIAVNNQLMMHTCPSCQLQLGVPSTVHRSHPIICVRGLSRRGRCHNTSARLANTSSVVARARARA